MAGGATVTVRHTQRPEGEFTTIRPGAVSAQAATAIASRGPVTLLTVSSPRMLDHAGFMQRLFEVFGEHQVSIGLIATAEVSVSVTVEDEVDLEALLREDPPDAAAHARREFADRNQNIHIRPDTHGHVTLDGCLPAEQGLHLAQRAHDAGEGPHRHGRIVGQPRLHLAPLRRGSTSA